MRIVTAVAQASVLLAACAIGCGSDDEGEPRRIQGVSGSSGASGSSGTSATGGSSGSAGSNGVGGSTGGTSASGGSSGSSAGKGGASGTSATGGSSGTGGGGDTGGAGGKGGTGGSAGEATGGSAGSGNQAGKGGSSGSSGTGGGNPDPSTGCGQDPPVTSAGNRTLQVGAQERRYFFTPPTDYDSSQPYPIIFGFHGAGGNGEGTGRGFGIETAAGGQALFVYPDGLGGVWSLQNEGVDIQMLDAIISTLSAEFCVDQGSIFAMGFSYGGWMATQAGCARPNVFRAIASAAGGGPQGSCSGSVAAMLMHGDNDDAEPIASGERSRDRFVEANGCDSTSSSPAEPSPCVAYAGCDPGKDVLWCEFAGVHQVPDFGPAGMWSFFSRLRP